MAANTERMTSKLGAKPGGELSDKAMINTPKWKKSTEDLIAEHKANLDRHEKLNHETNQTVERVTVSVQKLEEQNKVTARLVEGENKAFLEKLEQQHKSMTQQVAEQNRALLQKMEAQNKEHKELNEDFNKMLADLKASNAVSKEVLAGLEREKKNILETVAQIKVDLNATKTDLVTTLQNQKSEMSKFISEHTSKLMGHITGVLKKFKLYTDNKSKEDRIANTGGMTSASLTILITAIVTGATGSPMVPFLGLGVLAMQFGTGVTRTVYNWWTYKTNPSLVSDNSESPHSSMVKPDSKATEKPRSSQDVASEPEVKRQHERDSSDTPSSDLVIPIDEKLRAEMMGLSPKAKGNNRSANPQLTVMPNQVPGVAEEERSPTVIHAFRESKASETDKPDYVAIDMTKAQAPAGSKNATRT